MKSTLARIALVLPLVWAATSAQARVLTADEALRWVSGVRTVANVGLATDEAVGSVTADPSHRYERVAQYGFDSTLGAASHAIELHEIYALASGIGPKRLEVTWNVSTNGNGVTLSHFAIEALDLAKSSPSSAPRISKDATLRAEFLADRVLGPAFSMLEGLLGKVTKWQTSVAAGQASSPGFLVTLADTFGERVPGYDISVVASGLRARQLAGRVVTSQTYVTVREVSLDLVPKPVRFTR